MRGCPVRAGGTRRSSPHPASPHPLLRGTQKHGCFVRVVCIPLSVLCAPHFRIGEQIRIVLNALHLPQCVGWCCSGRGARHSALHNITCISNAVISTIIATVKQHPGLGRAG